MNIGILGGGLSGVTVQRFLNCDSEILEKEDRVGGLCRTFQKNGFYYDIGGHILFSKNNQMMDFVREVLTGNLNSCRRNNKVYYKNRYVKYPFENGLGVLEKEDIYECIIGYLKNNYPAPTNFLEWILHIFGDGIASKYLIPYNEKIWKTPLELMGIEWVERVPKPPMEDIIKSALGIETEGYTHQLNFLYPTEGGIESFVKASIKDKAKISTKFEVSKVRKKGNSWAVSNGTEEKYYDKLILTIPLKDAINYLENVPDKVVNAIKELRNNTVRVALIGVNNESLLDKSAIYIPSREVVTHRVCYMGYFSRNNAPMGTSSLIAEVTTNKGDELYNISDSGLVERIVDDLDRVGIICKNEVIETDIKNLPYAYVVYDLNYQKNIKIVRDYFDEIGIILHGRFAEFEYINMDEAVLRSMKLADRLNNG